MSQSIHDGDSQPRPIRRLIVVALMLAALIGSLVVGTMTTGKSRFTPDLALDLEGGTQIILTPVTTDGSEVTSQDIREAINIIRQRVDATGVAEAEITAQGGSNIIVSLPGQPSQETLDLVRTSAVLRMRPSLTILDPGPLTADSVVKALGDKAQGMDPAQMNDEDLDKAIRQLADVNGDGELATEPAQEPANPSDPAWITEQLMYEAYKLDCTVPDTRSAAQTDNPNTAIVACDPESQTKHLLGPAELDGTNLDTASSGPDVNSQGVATGGWAVNMSFDDEGGKIFADVTARLSGLQYPQNAFAAVLDGKVISFATVSSVIPGGEAKISGSFNAKEAANLANQLKFGSLPLQFEVQSEEQISATLGSEQLVSGLIAGLVGMLLIVGYMIWQYHALGVIAIGSILLSTGMSYLIISLLSWTMGYRLSMAGVLGIIISIGVTADSFIVYFERIRDEIRDGRTIPAAVRHGWDRAKRTIIISDVVNLVAAVVLYLLTVGSVRGFAFTLGITTVLDLFVVTMFTYPLMTLIAKTEFFGKGKRGSGMDPIKLEALPRYRGRGVASRSTPKRSAAKKRSLVTSDGVELHDYELPDARFTDAGAPGFRQSRREEELGSGESLAKRRARERRQARKAQAAEGDEA
ncbi:protein translocase subunit SecD [Trueperella bialowiezensis]|uniref:Protein translocase subunit SecD n=1 Tax=Trueperella bialowiezensis TaxID=312285 RepID=A0A448PC00_9ACTO|nr:protein translocase subunit SecD [Trueperella bialowiezensis]VEI12478.1 preprotein translocase subunit SecD [Trueperella bialowiezensis]